MNSEESGKIKELEESTAKIRGEQRRRKLDQALGSARWEREKVENADGIQEI